MSLEKHIEMLHSHIDRQAESHKKLVEVFGKNQKNLMESSQKLMEENEALKIQLGIVMEEAKELRGHLKAPAKLAIHKMFRKGIYKKKKELTLK